MTFYIFHSTWVFLLLLQCVSYESCSVSDELIKNFWTVFFELSEENKKRFLGRFCVEHMNILMHLHYLGLSLLFASHPHIVYFSLVFLYGTDRVPVGGFSKRSLKILLSDCPDAEDRLPEAQTCFGRLILPKYSDINTLRDKLIHAISFCKVFGRA